jgi:flagellar biosynthetic protein FliR
MDYELLHGCLTSLFLHMVRTGAFFWVVPLFGQQRDSLVLRLVLSVALGAVFWWTGPHAVQLPPGLLALGVTATREAFVGLLLGFALSTLLVVLVSAGEVISSEMGFSMARVMNPETGTDATVISQLFQVFGFLLILHFNLHHEALRILQQTYSAIPVGACFDLEPLWQGIRVLLSESLLFSLQYAIPVLGVMVLLTGTLVLLARAVPNINLMEFSFAAKVLLAMLATAWFLVDGAPFLCRAFASLLGHTRAMFAT